ncbi:cytochrome P450 [Rhodobacteraceae bacterium NNCM2]|nr:cytochrome P450 [Coraliihabitans acroporae]
MLVTPPLIDPPHKPLSIPQVVRAARRNLIEIIPGLAYQQPMVSGRTVARWHMLQDPGGLEYVLKDNVENYPKSAVTLRLLRPAIGDSLFNAEGAHWRWQRRAAAPVFQHRNLIALSPFMTGAAERTVRRLEAAAGGKADLYTEMVTATFDVISDVAMSGDKAIDHGAVSRSVTGYIETIGRVSLFDVLALPDWIPRPAHLMNRGGINQMQQMMDRVIAERTNAPRRDDLMSLMLEASDPETGRAMTAEELRDNMLAFLVAGHETTALALAWSIYLTALDPKVQDRLAEEARAACGDGPATAEELPKLGYHRQVIEEAMRLYPPAGMLSRDARAGDEICGREIRKGDTVILPIYALHRHRLWWENADQFDPENFAPARVKARNRYLWLPFGAGPRICIGMNFAIIEAQIILASLMARFRFTPIATEVPIPQMVMTLRPTGGVKLQVERR